MTQGTQTGSREQLRRVELGGRDVQVDGDMGKSMAVS